MSIVTEILNECSLAGLTLIADGDNIRCRGNRDVISLFTPKIKAHKPALLAALSTGERYPGVTRLGKCFAEAHGKPLESVMALLSDREKLAVELGNKGTVRAWTVAVSLLDDPPTGEFWPDED